MDVGMLFGSVPPVYPVVSEFFSTVQGMFLTVIVPSVVGLFVAIFGIRWALRWIHGASLNGRHVGSTSWEYWTDSEWDREIDRAFDDRDGAHWDDY